MTNLNTAFWSVVKDAKCCCLVKFMQLTDTENQMRRGHVVTQIKFGYTLIFKGEALKGDTRKSTTIVGVRLNALLYTLAMKFTKGTPNLYLVRFCQQRLFLYSLLWCPCKIFKSGACLSLAVLYLYVTPSGLITQVCTNFQTASNFP